MSGRTLQSEYMYWAKNQRPVRYHLASSEVPHFAMSRWDIDPAANGARLPPLLLQPLVENAVKHGVERKPGPCKVTIASRLIESDQPLLEISVSDDGAGLSEGIGSGVGLANIRAQLALRFGDSASLSLQSGSAGGAVAALRIPFPA